MPLAFSVDKGNCTNGPKGVSVIVAARNEATNLPQLIEALLNQVHKNFEVIIVNDRSTDDSLKILESACLKFKNLKIININSLPNNWNGKKYAIKKGVESAKYDVILLTDGDCIPKRETWISSMTSVFDESTHFVLGFSPYQEKSGLLNHLIRFETLWTGIQYLSMAKHGQPYMGVGRNMAYKKSTFLNDSFSKTFEIVGGDDDLLVNQYANSENTKIILDPDSQTVSFPKTSWHSYFKQKIRHLSVGVHYRKKDRTRLGILTLCNMFGWILLCSLVFVGFETIWTLLIFGTRSIIFYTIFTRIGRKLEVRLLPFTLPLLDLFYNFFYMVVGLRALTAKRIKWS